MIKIFVSDLDGTLFYPKRIRKGLTKKNRNLLKNFIEKGGEVVLASGRNLGLVTRFKKLLNSNVTFLCCNGAYMYKDNKVLDTYPLDSKLIYQLVKEVDKNLGIMAWTLFDDTNTIYIDNSNLSTFVQLVYKFINGLSGFYKHKLKLSKKTFEEHLEYGVNYKLMAVFGAGKKARERAYKAYELIKKDYGDFFSIAVSGTAIEITKKGVTKGNALEEYCKQINIKPDEVIVCGDSGNDISMFLKFPHSFAMRNSPSFVASKANHLIDRVSDVQKYLKNPQLMENDSIK